MRSVVAVTVLVALAAIAGVAQLRNSESDGLVARLSYHTGGMGIDWRYQEGYPQFCFAVYHSGYYQISRLTEQGNQMLQGNLSKQHFAELGRLLKNIKFDSEAGGIDYLEGAESLISELVRQGKTVRYFWINRGDRNPLPKSATDLVNWLEDFQARGATPFKRLETSDIRICPSMNENPLPLTTSLNNTSGNSASGVQEKLAGDKSPYHSLTPK